MACFVTKGEAVDIFDRDGGICQICGEPVERIALHPRDAKDKSVARHMSIDHIVPVSRGGSHDPSNLRLVHRGCNSRAYQNEQRFLPKPPKA